MKTRYIQQGDVLLFKIASLPNSKQTGMKLHYKRTAVLQHGEATGHSHKMSGNFRVYESDPNWRGERFLYLVVNKKSDLSHEEHKTLSIPKGIYKIKIVREYDHFLEETRRVRD